MLFLSRKIGESIVINNTVELTVIEIRGKTVKIGFNFPPDASVLRKEIHDKIMAENVAASHSESSESDFLDALSNLGMLPDKPPAK
ncbi:MAG: carbon storage regulator [Rhodospirillales bacterium 12-54-5]|nr:MAG: carbon storage regulator [Rhodospirillales bacterium 12-54-5]